MGRFGLRDRLLVALSADTPRSTKEIVAATRLDEKQVRIVLEVVWKEPAKAEELLVRIATENSKLFEFEKDA